MSGAEVVTSEAAALAALAAAHPVVVADVLDRSIAGIEWDKKRQLKLYGEHCLNFHHVELLAAKQVFVDLVAAAERAEEVLRIHGLGAHYDLLHAARVRTQGVP